MPTMRSMLDPITHKTYDYTTATAKEDHLFEVLAAACTDRCPPDTADYRCNGEDVPEEAEAAQCAECYRRLAHKVAGPDTTQSKRLEEAIELAIHDQCPQHNADKVCIATEDENTDEETCTMCIQRWATIPFAKFRK